MEEPGTGRYYHGDTPGLADLCLFGQVVNNRCYDIPSDGYLIVRRTAGNLSILTAPVPSLAQLRADYSFK